MSETWEAVLFCSEMCCIWKVNLFLGYEVEFRKTSQWKEWLFRVKSSIQERELVLWNR